MPFLHSGIFDVLKMFVLLPMEVCLLFLHLLDQFELLKSLLLALSASNGSLVVFFVIQSV